MTFQRAFYQNSNHHRTVNLNQREKFILKISSNFLLINSYITLAATSKEVTNDSLQHFLCMEQIHLP